MLVHEVRLPTVPSDRPPLLILLHGVGSNERGMAALAPGLDARLVIVSARSPLTLGPAAFAWFHVKFTATGPVIDAAEAAAGWKQVAAFVDECVAKYGADPTRVYVGGFSQGAIMALAALLTAPERIAGVVAMSGRLLPEVLPHAAPVTALTGKPVLLIHGVADDKLPVTYARSARERLTPLGVALTYRELGMAHEITRESLGEVAAWLTARLDEA
jgi:phospholipase/carboxylesterase